MSYPKQLTPEEQVNAYCGSATEYILALATTLNLSGALLYARLPDGKYYRYAYVKAESDEVVEMNGHFLSPSEAAFTSVFYPTLPENITLQGEPCIVHRIGTQRVLFHRRTTAQSFQDWKYKLKECLTFPTESDGYCIFSLSLWIDLEFEDENYFSIADSGFNSQHMALREVLTKMPGGKTFFRAM